MGLEKRHSFARSPTGITLSSVSDEKEYAKSRKSIRGKFEDFCSDTSFTPISHVYKAGSLWKKLVWVIVSLGLTAYMSYQCQNLIRRYLQYPSEVDMELAFSPELEFPSVTICNLNPIRYSALAESRWADEFASFEDDGAGDPMYQQAMSRFWGSGSGESSEEDSSTMTTESTDYQDTASTFGPTEESTYAADTNTPGSAAPGSPPPTLPPPTSPPSSTTNPHGRRRRRRAAVTSGNWTEQITNTSYNQWELLDDNIAPKFYNQLSSQSQATERFSKLVATLSDDVIEQMGHRKSDFIFSCKWQGYPCSPKNFTSFVNYKYGNCFTFNAVVNKSSTGQGLRTSSPGPLYGLVLEMFIEQDEYTSSISPEAGARVVIHTRGKMPFPEDEGFTVSPGFLTSVGMRKTSIIRLPLPHGNCSSSFTNDNSLYDDEDAVYSKQACMKSCLQQALIDRCLCGSTSYPLPGNVTFCKMEDERCVYSVNLDYKQNDLGCDENCPLPCNDEAYTLTISNAVWPARKYEHDLKSRMMKSSTKLMRSVMHGDSEDDVAKVEIFYQELNYQKIQQKAAYEFENVLSDVGGQLGLWLGVSILALGEILDFLVSVFHYLWFKMSDRRTQNPRSTPILPYRPPKETDS